MFGKRCPSCGVKLGNYAYADACPHCDEVLEANLPLADAVTVKVGTVRAWPVRAFFRVRGFVES